MCFVVLFDTLRAGEKIKIGGLALKTLKKLNGDKLGLPSLSNVLAKAMGLGDTALNKYACNFAVGISLGLMVSINVYFRYRAKVNIFL